jgi:putative DNA primase/helicase
MIELELNGTAPSSIFDVQGAHTVVTNPTDARLVDAAAKVYALDNARRLNVETFPNLPSKPSYAPPSTIPNIQHLVKSYGITIRYDVIKKKLLITMPGHSGSPENFDSVALTQILSLVTLNDMQVGPIGGVIEAIGDRQPYNPVTDWVKGVPWDGTDRLPALYATLTERNDYPAELKTALMRRWFLSAIAAAFKPSGFHCRGVLTLQGPQGIGKTRWVNSLVSDPALAKKVIKLDHLLDPGDKDSRLSAITHWIVEIGELDGSLRKADIGRLKGFLTADQDKVRRPYGRTDSEYPRKTVFCATVNDWNFLVDPTGNNRWWTIPVLHIDFQHGIDMQQVWAQLAVMYEAGEQWWLTPDEERMLDEQNKKHNAVSALRERILEVLDLDTLKAGEGKPMTCIRFLKHLGIDHPTNPQCKECGSILREYLGEPKKHSDGMKWRIPFRPGEMDL